MIQKRLYEILLDEIWEAESKANRDYLYPPREPKKTICIKVHPHTFHDLMKEHTELVKAGEPPYIEHQNMRTDLKFFGIPILVDPKTEKWEIVI